MTRTGTIALVLALFAWPAGLHAQGVEVEVQQPPPQYQDQVPAPPPPQAGVVAPVQPAPVAVSPGRPGGFVQAPAAPQPSPRPRTEERVHVGMVVGGSVVLGVSWLIHGALISPFAGYNAGFGGPSGYEPEWEAFRFLGLVPVLGPWLQLAVKPNSFGADSWAPYLIVDGLLQAGGLALLIVGATVRETVTVYGDREGGGPYLALGATPGGLQFSGGF